MMKPYCIITPEYRSTSAGIMALHLLNDHLISKGCGSRLLVFNSTEAQFNPPTDQEITIYPDCFAGNLYRAKNVVRYLMMYAGFFGSSTDSNFPVSEYIYYHSPEFVLNGRNPDNILTVPVIREERFPYIDPEARFGSACLAIKYRKAYYIPDNLPEGCVHIDNDTNLEKIFRYIKTLYTYDNSIINVEAALCGIDVQFRFNPKFERLLNLGDYFDYKDLRASYKAQKVLYNVLQLPTFIERTQERFKNDDT